MIFQYSKKDGQIISSYPEFFGKPPDIKVFEDDKIALSSKDIGYSALDPITARRYIDPRLREQYNIHRRKVVFDKKGNIKHLLTPNNEIVKVWKKKDIKKNLESWGKLYRYLKIQHPNLKIRDAMKKEGL